MSIFKGLLYVKHGAVGTKSEGPLYYLQTKVQDLSVEYKERNKWEPDYHLEFYSRRMVEIEGDKIDEKTVKVTNIKLICETNLP